MRSWQIAADLRPAAGMAVALVALHVVTAALPWACRVDALATLPLSWRALPGRGRVRALAMDAGSVACRDASGWWPATLEAGSRAWPGLVYLRLATAAGPMEVLLTRASLGATDFRRLKVLLRGAGGPGGTFC